VGGVVADPREWSADTRIARDRTRSHRREPTYDARVRSGYRARGRVRPRDSQRLRLLQLSILATISGVFPACEAHSYGRPSNRPSERRSPLIDGSPTTGVQPALDDQPSEATSDNAPGKTVTDGSANISSIWTKPANMSNFDDLSRGPQWVDQGGPRGGPPKVRSSCAPGPRYSGAAAPHHPQRFLADLANASRLDAGEAI